MYLGVFPVIQGGTIDYTFRDDSVEGPTDWGKSIK